MLKVLLTSAATAAFMSAALPAQAEVTFMYPDWLSALVEPGIENFEKETGETVDAIKLPTEGYVERTALDLAAGTAADVVVLDSFVVSELASTGYLHPLDDAAGDWDQYQYYLKGLLDVVSYDGSVYALPTDTDVRMLWYSKPLFEEAGIATPWQPKTWDDVIDAAQKIKDGTDAKNTFLLPAGTKQGEAATMQGFYMALLGADVPDDDRNRLRARSQGKWIGDSPALRRTLELYRDVYVDRELTTAAINYATDLGVASRQALLEGDAGIYSGGSWEYLCIWNCDGENIPSQEEREGLVGWTPWPGSGVEGAKATTNISGGWAIAVNASAADKDLGFQLITSIFDAGNFGDWTVATNRMAVRTDISGSDAYSANDFLAEATALAADTTGRDTYPGYQIVSTLVQQMTADILDGASVEDVIEEYHAALVDEFGEENVITFE